MLNQNIVSSATPQAPAYITASMVPEDFQISRLYIFSIALVQGAVLAYLYQSIEREIWPATDLTWLIALVTFFVSFPSLFLLTASKSDYKALGYLIGIAKLRYRVAIDLSQNGVSEMLTIIDAGGYFQGWLWVENQGAWEKSGIQLHVPKNTDLKYSL